MRGGTEVKKSISVGASWLLRLIVLGDYGLYIFWSGLTWHTVTILFYSLLSTPILFIAAMAFSVVKLKDWELMANALCLFFGGALFIFIVMSATPTI